MNQYGVKSASVLLYFRFVIEKTSPIVLYNRYLKYKYDILGTTLCIILMFVQIISSIMRTNYDFLLQLGFYFLQSGCLFHNLKIRSKNSFFRLIGNSGFLLKQQTILSSIGIEELCLSDRWLKKNICYRLILKEAPNIVDNN